MNKLIEWWTFRALNGDVAYTPPGTSREEAIAIRARTATVDPERLILLRRLVTPEWESTS